MTTRIRIPSASTFLRLCCALCFGICATAAAEPPPVAAYAALPQLDGVDVSQLGDRILMLRPRSDSGESQDLVVTDRRNGETRLVLASDPAKFLFNWCAFKTDVRIVCSIRSYVTLSTGATEPMLRLGRAIVTRLIAIDADGSNYVALIPNGVTKIAGDIVWNAQTQDRIVSWLPDDPDHMLIQLNRDDHDYPSVYKLDVNKNTLHRVRKFRAPITRWAATASGKVVLGFGLRGLKPHLFVPQSFRRFKEFDLSRFTMSDTPDILGVSPDGESMYATIDPGTGREQLQEVRLSDLRVVRTLLRDSDYDVSGPLLWDMASHKPFGIVHFRDKPGVEWFDDAWKARFAMIDRALPDAINRPTSWSRDGSVLVVSSTAARSAPAFYLYDNRTKSIEPLGAAYPDIPTEALGTTQFVEYVARDGMRIPAYLTLPPDAKPEKLPTIILPHGGPNVRDTGAFDYWSQFFVSRGYAVLQPNFRGSSGYGTAFQQAGYGQWGEAMQDDVIDGLDWLVASGIADPGRVCIVGGSYGGYVALVAAYKTPDRFRCAVSIAGIADLKDMKRGLYSYQFGNVSRARLQSDKVLDRDSPIAHADDVAVPLLIVHGDQDRVVFVEQSMRFVNALEKAGKPYKFVLQQGGDHFLSVASQRIQLLQEIDAFLREHLGS